MIELLLIPLFAGISLLHGGHVERWVGRELPGRTFYYYIVPLLAGLMFWQGWWAGLIITASWVAFRELSPHLFQSEEPPLANGLDLNAPLTQLIGVLMRGAVCTLPMFLLNPLLAPWIGLAWVMPIVAMKYLKWTDETRVMLFLNGMHGLLFGVVVWLA